MRITNAKKQEAVWTIDLKDTGTIYAGPVRAPAKAGVTLSMSDDTFEQLASGKVRFSFSPIVVFGADVHHEQIDGQKAFMTGKLKTKGNVMLATKLGAVLGVSRIASLGWGFTTDVACIVYRGQGEALDFPWAPSLGAISTGRIHRRLSCPS